MRRPDAGEGLSDARTREIERRAAGPFETPVRPRPPPRVGRWEGQTKGLDCQWRPQAPGRQGTRFPSKELAATYLALAQESFVGSMSGVHRNLSKILR